jgi:glycerophosphoryl diester phosphodiesterase
MGRSTIALGIALLAASPGCASSTSPSSQAPELCTVVFPRPFHIIAHRGASAQAPENTLPAFERARELGAFEVELDVQLSSDDVLILFHDATLDEKTDRSGAVRDHTAAELEATEIGTWFDRTHPNANEKWVGTTLARLESLFEQHGRALYYHVEIKASDEVVPRLVVDTVKRHGLHGRVTMTSFRFEQLERLRALDADLPIGLLIRRGSRLEVAPGAPDLQGGRLERQKGWVDAAQHAGFQQVAVAAPDLSPEIIRYARMRGLEVRAYGVKTDRDMDRAIGLGVNGMTTDHPDRLIRRLVEYLGEAGG